MFACLEYLKQTNDAYSYTGEGKHKHPTMTIKVNKEYELTYLLLSDTTMTVGRALEDDETTKLPKPTPDHIMLCPHSFDYVGRAMFDVKYDSKDDMIKANIISYASNDGPTSRPIWELNGARLKHDDPKKFTIRRNFNLNVRIVVRQDIVYDIKFKWPLQRLETRVGYELETQEGDETQDYNPLGGSAAGGGGAAGGVGGAGAGAAVPDQITQLITEGLDKTKVAKAYDVYILDPANAVHMQTIRAEIDNMFPAGSKIMFGKEGQVFQAWCRWSKNPANADVVKKYAKIAQDFNTENKANRPVRARPTKRKSKKDAKKKGNKRSKKNKDSSSAESEDSSDSSDSDSDSD